MRKKIIVTLAAGALGVGALGTAALADSPKPTQSPGIAQPTPPNADQRDPAYTGSIRIPQAAESGESEATEAAALARLATITQEQARSAALARYPGATTGAITLDDEDGFLVWSVELVDLAKAAWDVKVDAGTGAILHVDADGSDPDVEGSAESD